MQIKNFILRHFRENRWQYLLISTIFAIGFLAGNYEAANLSAATKNYLLGLLDNFLRLEVQSRAGGQDVLTDAMLNQGKIVLAIWFIGLTVIGLPLILAAVFFRGVSLGFTLKFLIHEKAGGGLAVGMLSIVPQNLIYIPFLLIWSVIAINFTMNIVKGIYFNNSVKRQGLISYTMLMLAFLIFFFLGSVIEAYLSPYLLSVFLTHI
ncbi:MAG: stage II sporulation protein M [Syntrophomonadaceae bacterium]|jgi:stage II sporulation protein M|nr:stage II sporulation protein M [Syntrophomonadaceae bacterium]